MKLGNLIGSGSVVINYDSDKKVWVDQNEDTFVSIEDAIHSYECQHGDNFQRVLPSVIRQDEFGRRI